MSLSRIIRNSVYRVLFVHPPTPWHSDAHHPRWLANAVHAERAGTPEASAIGVLCRTLPNPTAHRPANSYHLNKHALGACAIAVARQTSLQYWNACTRSLRRVNHPPRLPNAQTSRSIASLTSSSLAASRPRLAASSRLTPKMSAASPVSSSQPDREARQRRAAGGRGRMPGTRRRARGLDFADPCGLGMLT